MTRTERETLDREMRERPVNPIIPEADPGAGRRNARPIEPPADPVGHPSHYTGGRFECIDVIEELDLPFHLSAALKYLWRYRKKGKPIEDLKKARWYIDRYIGVLEKQEDKTA
jgi:hypothetical protein